MFWGRTDEDYRMPLEYRGSEQQFRRYLVGRFSPQPSTSMVLPDTSAARILKMTDLPSSHMTDLSENDTPDVTVTPGQSRVGADSLQSRPPRHLQFRAW